MNRRSLLIALSVLVLGCSGGAPTDVDGARGEFELGKAIMNGDEAKVTALLDAQPDALNEPDVAGQTPLHYAARANNAKMVKLLIDRGADLEALNADDEVPAMVARDAGASDEVIDLLTGGGQ